MPVFRRERERARRRRPFGHDPIRYTVSTGVRRTVRPREIEVPPGAVRQEDGGWLLEIGRIVQELDEPVPRRVEDIWWDIMNHEDIRILDMLCGLYDSSD
jgi:hypothetical protein